MEGKEDTRADMEGKEGIRARRTQALTPDRWAETSLERKARELWRSCHRCRPTWRELIASIQPMGHPQLFGKRCTQQLKTRTIPLSTKEAWQMPDSGMLAQGQTPGCAGTRCQRSARWSCLE